MRIFPYMSCPEKDVDMDPLQGCSVCHGVGYHRSMKNPDYVPGGINFMSTNYYWMYDEPSVPEIELPTGELVVCHPCDVPYDGTHVGKRYGCDNAQTAFIFAIEPYILLTTLVNKADCRPGEKIIEDEYGRQFTAKEFSIQLYDCARWEMHSIGQRFC